MREMFGIDLEFVVKLEIWGEGECFRNYSEGNLTKQRVFLLWSIRNNCEEDLKNTEPKLIGLRFHP